MLKINLLAAASRSRFRHPFLTPRFGVTGLWHHTSTEFSAHGVRDVLSCKGEICVSRPGKGERSLDANSRQIVFFFRGRCSAVYSQDCYSTIMPNGLRRAGKRLGGDRTEGWLIPAQSKLVSIWISNLPLYKNCKDAGLPVVYVKDISAVDLPGKWTLKALTSKINDMYRGMVVSKMSQATFKEIASIEWELKDIEYNVKEATLSIEKLLDPDKEVCLDYTYEDLDLQQLEQVRNELYARYHKLIKRRDALKEAA
jgi:hypothetical protein